MRKEKGVRREKKDESQEGRQGIEDNSRGCKKKRKESKGALGENRVEEGRREVRKKGRRESCITMKGRKGREGTEEGKKKEDDNGAKEEEEEKGKEKNEG